MLDSDKLFSGSIPENYDRYMVPLIFARYAADLARRAVSLSPTTVLEIAAGTGAVPRALAPKLPSGARYVVTDLNQAMLDYAASQQPPDDRISWRQADAMALPFDDATFDKSAEALENPDHVDISIHNYRWRLSLAEGEAKYDGLEKQLAAFPTITVPTITLEGDANGAPHPDPSAYVKRFSGKYEHRLITGGVGHNLPQEAPSAFAKAIVDVDRF